MTLLSFMMMPLTYNSFMIDVIQTVFKQQKLIPSGSSSIASSNAPIAIQKNLRFNDKVKLLFVRHCGCLCPKKKQKIIKNFA